MGPINFKIAAPVSAAQGIEDNAFRPIESNRAKRFRRLSKWCNLPSQMMNFSLSRKSFPGLLLAAVLGVAPLVGPAGAQDNAAAADTATAEIEALIERLEDPDQRRRLIDDLRALRQAATTEGEAKDDAADVLRSAPDYLSKLLGGIALGLSDIGAEFAALTRQVGDPGRIAGWFADQATDADRRRVWFEIVLHLAIALGGGLVIAWLLGGVLTKPKRALEIREAPSLFVRLPLLTARTLLEFIPLAGFMATAYAALAFSGPGHIVHVVVLAAVHAVVVSRAVLTVGRAVLTPFSPTLRLFSLADETAGYAYVWLRRLVNVPVYGFFVVQIGLTLGLPAGGYVALTKILGLAEALLLLILILQIRDAVAAALKNGTESKEANRFLAAVRRRTAEIWHVFAALYIAAAYFIWALEIEGGFVFVAEGTAGTAVVLLAAWGARLLAMRGLERVFRISDRMRTRYPVLEARANRYLPLARNIVAGLVYVIAAMLVLQSWQIDVGAWLASDFGRLVISRALNIFVVLAFALIVWEVVSTIITVYLEKTDDSGEQVLRSARARTLLPLLKNALLIVILTMAILTTLSEFGVNIGPLLAGAGVVGLAIGFGAQTLVKDIITGAFILFEDSIAVGDFVTVGGLSGTVEAMTIRTIRLRDTRGTVHTIPFSTVDTVTNMTKDFAFHVAEVGVAYRENTDEVADLLQEIGAELQDDPEVGGDILEPITIDGVDRLDDSAVVVRARLKTKPGSQWRIKRAFNGLVKKRFDERGIEIPYPHQTIYFGEDKAGGAPPLRVAQDGPAKPEFVKPDKAPATKVERAFAHADADDGGDGGDGL